MKIFNVGRILGRLLRTKGQESSGDRAQTVSLSEPWPEHVLGPKAVLISSDGNFLQALKTIRDKKACHLVHSNRDDFKKELEISIGSIENTQKFLTNFPHKILSDRGAKTLLEKQFQSMDEKEKTIAAFKEVLSKVSECGGHEELVLNVVDELFTNALYNAPTDESGLHINKNKSRKENVTISDRKVPSLFLFQDANQLAVGCWDYYGSFSIDDLVSRLIETYGGEQAQARMETGGAGLGFRMMLEHSSSLYIIVENNKRTCVCFTLPIGEGLKKALETPKNLHFICL